MPFPQPPRLKDKPAGPEFPADLRPKNPDRAAGVVLASMVLWTVLSIGATMLLIWILGPVLHLFRLSVLFLTGALICATWVGLSLGWRMGNLVVIAAMRETKIPSTSLYSPLVMRALELAAEWHLGQFRKHPSEQIPYIAHPAGVGMLLQKAGCDDETVAAGILHDAIEDCGVTEEELAVAMTPRVAELVAWVSEPPKTVPWAERKAAYREKLAKAPAEALRIAAADHAYNLRGILTIAETSVDVWKLFNADREQKIANEQEVLRIVSRTASPLVDAFADALRDVMALPA